MKFIASMSILVVAFGLVNQAPSTLVAHASAPTHTGQGMSLYDQHFVQTHILYLASYPDFGVGSKPMIPNWWYAYRHLSSTAFCKFILKPLF
jgi:hypothetical protein